MTKELWEERVQRKPLVRRIAFWVGIVALFVCTIGGFTVASFLPKAGSTPTPTPTPTPPSSSAGWGPARNTFTLNSPATYAVLNSITDNPNFGDERNFVQVKNAKITNAGSWKDTLEVHLGDEIYVRAYYENSAGDNFRDDPTSWIQGARAYLTYHTDGDFLNPVGVQIHADNASTVWDGATLRSKTLFRLVPEEKSGLIENNFHTDGYPFAVSTMTSPDGLLLGYQKMDGTIIPGFQYSGYISFKFRVVPAT